MAFIKVVGQDKAKGELAAAYERVAGKRGKVSNVLAVQSLDPKALAAHLSLYQAVMFSGEGLSRREREAVAVVVSAANGCPYCVAHHRAALVAHSSEGFAASATDIQGRPLAHAEDVGRHNAGDKVLGGLFAEGRLGEATILAVSGRASFEMAQKAVVARIGVLASVSAATSLAQSLSQEANATLCAFVRWEGLEVVAGGERLEG